MLSIIVAMSEDRVIGRNGKLPWHLPIDLKHFKSLTMGHAIIMGRKTFESIGKPLPGRTTIVLSRGNEIKNPEVLTARSIGEAVDLAPGDAEVFVIGGSEVFREALERADRIYLTLVHTTVPDGDAFFPEFNERDWHLVSEREVSANAENAHGMTFRVYERRWQ
jgi:dihydrofolate reductase